LSEDLDTKKTKQSEGEEQGVGGDSRREEEKLKYLREKKFQRAENTTKTNQKPS